MKDVIIRGKSWALVVIIFLVAIATGFWLGGMRGGHVHGGAATSGATTTWTCSMHPQIKEAKPGKCRICGMDLIPLLQEGGDDGLGPRELRLSEAARALAEIQVHPVERLAVEQTVRMVGTVEFDETRDATITAWVGGRLDRLYVDYTGITVKAGDHLVQMYSPEVLAAEEELLQAHRAVKQLADSKHDRVRTSAEATLTAARGKLRLWGLSAEQVKEIEERGTAADSIQINAPVGGVVVHKNAVEGMYVTTGTPIYRIADLSHVWVKLDAYESDLPWLRYGQSVEFTSEAHPGEVFNGRISFIDPVLTARTRTVKVRVNVDNASGKLKPGMFVKATVRTPVGLSGALVDQALVGKWISPMHPEIIKDGPGPCDVCGMDLVKAEELGFVSGPAGKLPLVIPATAPLLTGKRAVVYVQDAKDASKFEGRTVTLGSRAGDYYVVAGGLEEGEKVVVNGNFKIDSALQILARPSMMSATDKADAELQRFIVAPQVSASLAAVFGSYLKVQKALAADNSESATAAAADVSDAAKAVPMGALEGDAHDAWMDLRARLIKSAGKIASAPDIDKQRDQFDRLSAAAIVLAQTFGTGLEVDVHIVHCSMAFDDVGADWLQAEAKIANPYFGASMLKCGEIKETLGPPPPTAPTPEHKHHQH
jgi:Cu(I)/Ag(I) efflux system membrane fusion protein